MLPVRPDTGLQHLRRRDEFESFNSTQPAKRRIRGDLIETFEIVITFHEVLLFLLLLKDNLII